MYHVLNASENGNLGIKVIGKLTQDDYALLIPFIDRVRQEVGPLKLLCDMTECVGLGRQSVWEDLTNHIQPFHEIKRVAVVGDHQWIECGTTTFYPLLPAQVQYFSPNQRAMAWKWVREEGP